MSITSLNFLIFVLVVIIIYYQLPSKYQWKLLLGASLYFYFSYNVYNILYVLFTSLSIFWATNYMQFLLTEQKKWLAENKMLDKDQ